MNEEIETLNSWWASLTVVQKENIATKAKVKLGLNVPDTSYPGCTSWWNDADFKVKSSIHSHCVHHHGLNQDEWSEGDTFSY